MNRIIRGDEQIGSVPIKKIIMIRRSENGFKHNDKYDEKFPPVDVSKTIHVKQRYKYKQYDGVSMVIIMFQRTFFVTLIGYVR